MKRLPKEERAGLYITIIVHLVVLIVLLGARLGSEIKAEQTFLLDFSKSEEMEKLRERLEFEKSVNERLNEMLSQGGGEYVRNVVVDGSQLRDDRNSAEDARALYEDAARLQNELESGFSAPEEDAFAAVATQKPIKEEVKESSYSGPSVLTYSLEGRKASRLPIPAYRCIGAGEVKVNIGVDPQGNVLVAKIDEDASSPDACLRNFAVRAARLSKFSASGSAPARQSGYIIYQFIAQ